ncbi:MAG: HEPN domain-containing protein [Acidovorax sp.]|nr:HEPN domain-containing protein [Acidovorax sp.]
MREFTITLNLSEPNPNDATSVYHLGQGFYLAGNRCLLNIEVGPGVTQCLVSPGVVNLCLACELFLKAAITHQGKRPPKTHKLVELFALAPSDYVAEVKAAYEAAVPQPSFDELIKAINEYFVHVRYGHEFPIVAFHETPLMFLSKQLYISTASLLGARCGLQAMQP